MIRPLNIVVGLTLLGSSTAVAQTETNVKGGFFNKNSAHGGIADPAAPTPPGKTLKFKIPETPIKEKVLPPAKEQPKEDSFNVGPIDEAQYEASDTKALLEKSKDLSAVNNSSSAQSTVARVQSIAERMKAFKKSGKGVKGDSSYIREAIRAVEAEAEESDSSTQSNPVTPESNRF